MNVKDELEHVVKYDYGKSMELSQYFYFILSQVLSGGTHFLAIDSG